MSRRKRGPEPSIVERVLDLLRAYLPDLEVDLHGPEPAPAAARAAGRRRSSARRGSRRASRSPRESRGSPRPGPGGARARTSSTGASQKGSSEKEGPGRTRSGRTGPGSRRKAAPPVDATVAALYSELGLPYGADLATVRSAWRQLARQHHPDLHGQDLRESQRGAERLKSLNRAYGELRRRLRRRLGAG